MYGFTSINRFSLWVWLTNIDVMFSSSSIYTFNLKVRELSRTQLEVMMSSDRGTSTKWNVVSGRWCSRKFEIEQFYECRHVMSHLGKSILTLSCLHASRNCCYLKAWNSTLHTVFSYGIKQSKTVSWDLK